MFSWTRVIHRALFAELLKPPETCYDFHQDSSLYIIRLLIHVSLI